MSRYDEFRRLHDDFLLLPNAWDHASAAALAAAGFRAVGTTSLGVAAAAGLPDGAAATGAETVALVRRIAHLALVTVDIEGGFDADPAVVAGLVRELAELGAVGVNLEDARPDGTLAPIAEQCELIAAVKAAAPEVFLNARTDTFWPGGGGNAGELGEAVERVRAYREAGADGVFVPGAPDEAAEIELVAATDAPLNLLYAPGRHRLERLAELGVRRVSCGSLLYRVALTAAIRTAREIADGTVGPLDPMTYAEVTALS